MRYHIITQWYELSEQVKRVYRFDLNEHEVQILLSLVPSIVDFQLLGDCYLISIAYITPVTFSSTMLTVLKSLKGD